MLSKLSTVFSSALNEVGGFSTLEEKFPRAVASVRATDTAGSKHPCGRPPASYMTLLSEKSYPWTGMTFGLAINSIWYWCTDQVKLFLAVLLYCVQTRLRFVGC